MVHGFSGFGRILADKSVKKSVFIRTIRVLDSLLE